MHRLHAALTETLRLYATIRLDGIYAFQDDTLPVGFNVRKGDMVCYLPYAKGRTKFIRGDDEEEYKPERWLDGDGFFTLQAREPLQFQHSSLQFTNNQHASEKLHFDGNEKMHYVHATLTETLRL
ncbi:CytochromeC1 [Capsicum chinense]|nr:CytochromeC1 [Capsicum chinense]